MRTALFAPARLVAGAAWLRRLPWRWAAYGAALPRQGRRAIDAVIEPAGRPRGTAVLLTGCVAETLFDGTNHATAALLRHAGVRVVVPPGAGCCGALPLHLGAHDRAVSLARRASGVLADARADWVVTNAAGCGALVREYDQLLPGDPDAAVVAGKARDALELLAELGLPTARPWRRAPSQSTTRVISRTARACGRRFARCSPRSRGCASSSSPSPTPAAAAPAPTT